MTHPRSITAAAAALAATAVVLVGWSVHHAQRTNEDTGTITSSVSRPVAEDKRSPKLTALEILKRVDNSGLREAHAQLAGRLHSGAVDVHLTGEAIVQLKPVAAIDLKLNNALKNVRLEYLTVGGRQFARNGDQPWKLEGQRTSGGVQPWESARNPTIVGEQQMPLGRVWHIRAQGADGSPFDLWIRESDFYPLRLALPLGKMGGLTLNFDRFNADAVLAAPQA